MLVLYMYEYTEVTEYHGNDGHWNYEVANVENGMSSKMELNAEAFLNVAPAVALDELFAGYVKKLPFLVVVVEVLVLCPIPLNN